MAFFNLKTKKKVSGKNKSEKKKKPEKKKKIVAINKLMQELGIARDSIISAYEVEENPDDLKPEDYIAMQSNDGEVQAIVRLLTLPIKATPFHILPAKGDKGERDFIEHVLLDPPESGGMTTPLPFIIADMTRAVFEGFRLYEKVAKVIESGDYKGKISWKKLAPRDAQTVDLKTDKNGGFAGAVQIAVSGIKLSNIELPPEKCMLYTFQKEKHWLYGESILRAAYYHYDKKHKLYYISHKKAEIEALGLKILKINQTLTPADRTAAENVVDTIGINSRITLPPGVELEVERGSGGYDPLPLIDHHNTQMSRSALTQAMDQVKYAYPYGKGTPSSQFLILTLESIMNEMSATLNTYAIAPLIDFNYGTNAYPTLKFEKISDISKTFLREVFDKIMKKDAEIPQGFIDEVIDETAKSLNLKWVSDGKEKVKIKEEDKKEENDEKENKEEEEKNKKNKEALDAFEKGKLKKANELKMKAPHTPLDLKNKLLRVKDEKELIEKCYKLGEQLVYVHRNQKSKN